MHHYLSIAFKHTSIDASLLLFKALSPQCSRIRDVKACACFEGDLDTLGSIIPSSSSSSMVGTIKIIPDLFTAYGQSCASSSCPQTRYLQCGSNLICECTPHTFWDSLKRIFIPQAPRLGAGCPVGVNMCREDLNYTCLQFSILSGTTIINNTTLIDGGLSVGLGSTNHITLVGPAEEALIVIDGTYQRILKIIVIKARLLICYPVRLGSPLMQMRRSCMLVMLIIDEYKNLNLFKTTDTILLELFNHLPHRLNDH